MIEYTSYDIRHRLVRCDTRNLFHKNTPHTHGDRFAIVLYNKDLNYRDSVADSLSLCIKSRPPAATVYSLVFDTPAVDDARRELLRLLDATRFRPDRCSNLVNGCVQSHSKYGKTPGKYISFGVSASRKSQAKRAAAGIFSRRSLNRNNTQYSDLYASFKTYMDAFCPGKFGEEGCVYSSAIIAKNSLCEWHRDKTNIGHSSLTALGTFSDGGALLIQRDEDDS